MQIGKAARSNGSHIKSRLKMEPHGVFKEVTKQCTNKDHYQPTSGRVPLLVIRRQSTTSARPMTALLVYGWWGESRNVTQYSTRENVKTGEAPVEGLSEGGLVGWVADRRPSIRKWGAS